MTHNHPNSPAEERPPGGKSELIVLLREDAGGTTASPRPTFDGAPVPALERILGPRSAKLEPLFTDLQSSDETEAADQETTEERAQMMRFFKIEAEETQLESLAEELRGLDEVEAAYVKPPAELAVKAVDKTAPAEAVAVQPRLEPVESARVLPGPDKLVLFKTPNFTPRQGYRDPAPVGINVAHAWGFPGGRGRDVRIIDIEFGWRFTHQDHQDNNGGLLAGVNDLNIDNESHGTAVFGVVGGDQNTFGVTGICPEARLSAVSINNLGTATAIQTAANQLRPGDLIIIELQRGFIPIEWWPDDFLAIRFAVNRGVIVVAAAGNGGRDLDDPVLDNPQAGFPAWWRNPLRRNPDSGSILVGAGSPPAGTHGRNAFPGPNPPTYPYIDRSRIPVSNFGRAVDAQGWGAEVTTTGYGDLWRHPLMANNRNFWYTDVFRHTSAATPIVTGALGCVQGILRWQGRIPLTPARARQLLRTSGSPQQPAPTRPVTQRIGNRPNLVQMVSQALAAFSPWTGIQFTGNLGPHQTACWFTFNWPAHWHVQWAPVPVTPRPGAPQIGYRVRVERASDGFITYWICITNLTNTPVQVEGRYVVLGW